MIVYSLRIFPVVVLGLLIGCTGAATTEIPIDRRIAVNAQLDVASLDPTALASMIGNVASRFGGRISRQEATSIELTVPVEVWSEAFAQLQQLPEVTGGERAWGQDITDQEAALRAALAAATGDDVAALRDQLAFREERVANAVIVIRIAR